MSDGRNKLNDFSLLKSLVGGKSIKDKTDRLRKAHATAAKRNESQEVSKESQRPAMQSKSEQKTFECHTRQERINQVRTPFRMPQYGQKPQTELIVDIPEGQQQEELIIEINVEKERLKEEQRLFKWLCQRFPKCFDPKSKKPLKIGISEDIEIIYYNEHYAPVDPYILKNVIRRYVGDTRYQHSVIQYKQRFNLYGQPVQDFNEEHISYAKQRLDEIAEKAELRAQGINVREYYQQKREEQKKTKELQGSSSVAQQSQDLQQ